MATIPLGGYGHKAILAIMVGDILKIGQTPDDFIGIEYEIQSIEGDSSNAQIYLQDVEQKHPQRVIHYKRVD